MAFYPFNERGGNIVHNAIPFQPDLVTPRHYLILRQPFLSPPWRGFEPNWAYAKDVFLNIAGFVPLGFFLSAYLSSVGSIRRPLIVAVCFGCTVSLLIEVLQAYIPVRESGMTDVITNTLGAFLGAMFYHRLPTLRAMVGLRTNN